MHLQFDPILPERVVAKVSDPWGVVTLAPDLASVQRYDVRVVLDMPRTPTNTEMGNFMLDAKMYAPGDKASSALNTIKNGLMSELGQDNTLLAHARRPAILTYYSPPVDLAQKIAQLHWYILGWRQEAETISVDLFEGIEFAKGWRNVPATLRLEVQTARQTRLQIYSARVLFRARFHGLRWLMYNHRILSACFFITSFWATEVLFTALAWLALGFFIFGRDSQQSGPKYEEEKRAVKAEQDEDGHADLSDTERTFPTYGQQPPLRYEQPVKKEDGLMENNPLMQMPAATAAEADDEDEDADFVLDDTRWPRSDSGLGTSMDSSAGRNESIRRRKSRPSSASSNTLQ